MNAPLSTTPRRNPSWGRVAEILDAGAVANMMSIGHRTGLFDVMATLPPATTAEIAEAAQLAERYVREWLAVMVTGRIVTYDPGRRTYHLPPEHAACLTRSGELGNIAVYAQPVALMGAVQEKVLERFGSSPARRERGSFETLASLAPQDEGHWDVASP